MSLCVISRSGARVFNVIDINVFPVYVRGKFKSGSILYPPVQTGLGLRNAPEKYQSASGPDQTKVTHFL